MLRPKADCSSAKLRPSKSSIGLGLLNKVLQETVLSLGHANALDRAAILQQPETLMERGALHEPPLRRLGSDRVSRLRLSIGANAARVVKEEEGGIELGKGRDTAVIFFWRRAPRRHWLLFALLLIPPGH